jgi:prepilin-type N-terminal cleavage/methylation domain-containing protein
MRRSSSPLTGRTLGFTLIEVVVVLLLLVITLTTSYQIFNNCLRTEKEVERLTLPEKVGEGILALMRRDIAGCFYKGATAALGNQVFEGIDAAGPSGGEDKLFFLTTVNPKPREDLREWESIRTVCVVGYYLVPNQASGRVPTYTLLRKETVDFSANGIVDAPGMNYVVYDKVKSLDVWYFDGYEWFPEWRSEDWIRDLEELAAAQADAEARAQDRIDRVTNSNTGLAGRSGRGSPTAGTGAAGAAGSTRPGSRATGARTAGRGTSAAAGGIAEPGEVTEDPLEELTAPIPVAVRVELEVYAAVGHEILEARGEPVVRRFTTLVPILAARRLKLEIEDLEAELGAATGGAGGGGGSGGAVSTFGADLTEQMRGRGGPPGEDPFGGAIPRDLRRFLRDIGGAGGRPDLTRLPPGLGERALERLRNLRGGEGGGARGGGRDVVVPRGGRGGGRR